MSHCVAQAGLKNTLGSDDPPALASQNARITGMSHRAQPTIKYFLIQVVLWFGYMFPQNDKLKCNSFPVTLVGSTFGFISPSCFLNVYNSRGFYTSLFCFIERDIFFLSN